MQRSVIGSIDVSSVYSQTHWFL